MVDLRVTFSFLVLIAFVALPSAYGVQPAAFSNVRHTADATVVIEGLTGSQVKELFSEVSTTIDRSFRAEIQQLAKNSNVKIHYPKKDPHRIIGHWGFSDSIPFSKEPWKSAFKDMPQDEVTRIWRKTVERLTHQAVEATGLPPKQAKALVGIVYDTHLLGDWMPGNKVLNSVLSPTGIQDDVVKNLHRLFGNNSKFVKELAEELRRVRPKGAAHKWTVAAKQKYAADAMAVLKKHEIGKKLMETHGRFLKRKGIKYSSTSFKKALARLFPDATPPKTSGRPPKKFRDFKKQSGKMGKGGKGGVTTAPGILLADGRLLVALKAGATEGLMVFAVESGIAYYQHLKGNTFTPQYMRKLEDAAVKGAMVGGGIAVAVFLGATPAGWVALAVGSGTYLVADQATTRWHEYKDGMLLTKKDLAFYGIELNSVIDISDPDIPLNLEKW